jgi:hypothetical protein
VKKAEVFQGDDNMKLVGTSVFYVLVFLGIVSVAIGILGAITAKCYNRWCSGCVRIQLITSI